MSQISQAPPPIHHNDLSHLSTNSRQLHLIGTQSPQHYLSTHPTPVSCPISSIRSGLSLLFATTYLILNCLCTYLLFRSIVDSLDLHRLLHSVDHPTSPPPASWGVCCSSASTSSWQDKTISGYPFSIASSV